MHIVLFCHSTLLGASGDFGRRGCQISHFFKHFLSLAILLKVEAFKYQMDSALPEQGKAGQHASSRKTAWGVGGERGCWGQEGTSPRAPDKQLYAPCPNHGWGVVGREE